MGSKRVKAIVVDLDKTPPFGDPKKVAASIKEYTKMLREDSIVMNFYNKVGLSAFVGAGLTFAGLTGFCGMGMLLLRMPWNQIGPSTGGGTSGSCSVGGAATGSCSSGGGCAVGG